MKIVFAGTPANAAQTLRALANSPFEVVAVLTRTDAPVGRKRILTPSAVAEVAAELAIPTIKANRVDEAVREQIKDSGANLGVIVAGALVLLGAHASWGLAQAPLPQGKPDRYVVEVEQVAAGSMTSVRGMVFMGASLRQSVRTV